MSRPDVMDQRRLEIVADSLCFMERNLRSTPRLCQSSGAMGLHTHVAQMRTGLLWKWPEGAKRQPIPSWVDKTGGQDSLSWGLRCLEDGLDSLEEDSMTLRNLSHLRRWNNGYMMTEIQHSKQSRHNKKTIQEAERLATINQSPATVQIKRTLTETTSRSDFSGHF